MQSPEQKGEGAEDVEDADDEDDTKLEQRRDDEGEGGGDENELEALMVEAMTKVSEVGKKGGRGRKRKKEIEEKEAEEEEASEDDVEMEKEKAERERERERRESERLKTILSQFTPEQMTRYQVYTRSGFPQQKIKKVNLECIFPSDSLFS
jgi:hypothetical protein